MAIELIVISIIVICGFLFIIYILNKKLSALQNKTTDTALVEWLKTMQNSIDHTNKTLNEAMRTNSTDITKVLQENSKQLNERLDKAASVIRDVGREVGLMSEIGRNMKELQEFLKSPKLRGTIGEQVLKDLISQLFPKNSFHLQYEFASGEKVDAAIKTDAGILPIDAKFPMEQFQKMTKAENETDHETAKREFKRDIKKHIDAISKKYILPQEGTMDFALMYIPSESVYYEVIAFSELIDYAREARVYIVSPNTLYIHLQTILLSFEGKKIESKSREVFALLRALQIDYKKVEENMHTLGKHITNASSQFGNVYQGFSILGNKLATTKNLEEETIKKIEN